jgi:hypothetical protein
MLFDLIDLVDLSEIGDSIVAFVSDFFNSDDCQPNQLFDIDIPEISPGLSIDNEFSPLLEPTAFIDDNVLESDSLRFGDSSEIQQYQYELKHAKGLVDADRLLVNREQAEVDSIHGRLNSLSDTASHESNENLAHEYHNHISALELDLSSHQRKLEQARADLATHQAAEFNFEDKLKDALNSSKS